MASLTGKGINYNVGNFTPDYKKHDDFIVPKKERVYFLEMSELLEVQHSAFHKNLLALYSFGGLTGYRGGMFIPLV